MSEASGASRGFFYAVHNGLVFENSTACVYVETSTRPRLAGWETVEEESTNSSTAAFDRCD